MQDTIVLASTNAGKIRELRPSFEKLGLTVLDLSFFPDLPEVAETGSSFEENALLKAHTVAQATGYIAIADDSGLEVPILDNAPGVFSARYSDDIPAMTGNTRDERNINKLLAVLGNASVRARAAHFVCVMAACTPDGKSITSRGSWEGSITFTPRGTNGFGYDPIFFDVAQGKTAAELTPEEKNACSHRSKAVAQLVTLFPDFLKK